MSFAERLQAILAHQRVRPADLARRAGLSEATVSRLLAGQRQPSLDTAARLARALAVSLDALAG